MFRTVVIVLFSASSALAFQAGEEKPLSFKFEVSPETTYVTEPLLEHGFVDLIAAVNQKYSKNVTPETNAAVTLYETVGSQQLRPNLRDEFFIQLGMPVPDPQGQYFETFSQYTLAKMSEEDRKQLLKIWPEMVEEPTPWKRDDFPEVAAWLGSQTRFLHRLEVGLDRPHWFHPVVSEFENPERGQGFQLIHLSGTQSTWEISRAYIARAMLHQGENRPEEAWNDVLLAIRLNRHVASGPFLIQGNIGLRREQTAIQAGLKIVGHSALTENVWRGFLKQLDQLPNHTSMVEKVDFAERLAVLDMINSLVNCHADDERLYWFSEEDIIPKMLKNNWLIKADYNAALKFANKWFDRYVKAFRIESAMTRKKVLTLIDSQFEKLVAESAKTANFAEVIQSGNLHRFAGEAIGKVVLTYTHPSMFGDIVEREIETRQWNELLRTTLALKAYQSRHGFYPQSLGELVPDVLNEAPKDFFSDGPLIYGREDKGFQLYSIGINLTDDDAKNDEDGADDLVVRFDN